MSFERLVVCAGTGLLLLGCTAAVDPKEEAISATLREAAATSESAYDHQAALNHYTRLAEIDPDDGRALIGQARNLRILGQPKEAIKALRQGIDRMGERADLILELGKAQLAASLLEDARESLEKVTAIDAKNWEAHATFAILLDRMTEFPRADASYRRALALSPNNVSVLNNRALSLAQTGRLDDAIALLQKIVNGENSFAQARQNLAVLYAIKGDFKTAERLAKEDLPPEAASEMLAAFRLFHEP